VFSKGFSGAVREQAGSRKANVIEGEFKKEED